MSMAATSTPLPSADIGDILEHIPHRYPFLLVDRMEACEPGKWVRVTKNVSRGEWFLGPPGTRNDAMPQILVLEALAQAAGILCHYSGLMKDISQAVILFASASNCVFGRDARCGERLLFECQLVRSMRGVAKLTGKCTVDGDLIMSASISAVIRNLDVANAKPQGS